MKKIDQKKKSATTWFKFLRDKICSELEIIEKNNSKQTLKFKKKKWLRDKTNKKDLGGGEMSLLRGKVFEKAGVNISTVYGNFSEKLKGKFPYRKKKRLLGIWYFCSCSSFLTKSSSYSYEYKVYSYRKTMVRRWRYNSN